MIKDENRIVFGDVLRILTIFCVIIYHTATDRWMTTYSNSFNWYLLNFFTSNLRWCVPIFFMLSGMTFLDPKRNITIKKIYTKSILHILLALVFWSFTYKIIVAIIKQINGIQNISLNVIEKIITNILFEPAWMHLWFLYTLIAMYMLAPVFRVYTKTATQKNYLYLFALYILCIGIIPIIEYYLQKQILLFKINEIYGYTIYFFAGWYLYKYELNKKYTKILYLLGIISCISIFTISSYFSYLTKGPHIPLFFNYLSILNIFIACSIFLFVKNWINTRPILAYKINNNNLIRIISNCCFGIYLTHMISFNMIYPIYDKMLDKNQFLTILITPFVIFIISFIITYIIKQIPYLRKWIV